MKLLGILYRGILGSLLGLSLGFFLIGLGSWISSALDRNPSFDLIIIPIICGIAFFLVGVFDLLPRTSKK